jgi:hypothetical protein
VIRTVFLCSFSLAALALTAAAQSAGTFADVNRMSGWRSCGACAGKGGHGPTVPFGMKQHVGSPSIDGQAAQFWIRGPKHFGGALWWKPLGARPASSHFTYDLYYYLQSAGAPQALEFDINQSANGRKYIFGTECNIKGTHRWDVWDTAGHRWRPTGAGCGRPSSYAWHHVTIEAERAGAMTHFVAITMDGHKRYINKYYRTRASGGRQLNVAVQLDTDSSGTGYSLWADKISLRYR